MKCSKLRSYLLYGIFFITVLAPCRVLSQAAAISSSRWDSLTNDKAFYYRNEKEAIEKIKPVKTGALDKIIEAIFVFFGSTTGKVITWSIFFLALGWALYKIFFGDHTGLFKKRTAIPKTGAPQMTEEHLPDADWEALLRDAMQQQDVRMAIRYSYMRLLQLMQQNGMLQYRQDKTNYDYYRELADEQYKQPFKQLSRQYEYAWYGDYPLSAAAYNEYMQTFNTLKNRLHRP